MAKPSPKTRKSETPWRARLGPEDVFVPGRLELRVLRREPQADFAPHRHAGFAELVLILGGSGLHVSGGAARPLGAGDVFVISGEREHRYEKTRGLALVNLVIGSGLLKALGLELDELPGYRALFEIEPQARVRGELRQFLRLEPVALAPLLALVDSIERETESAAPGYAPLARALLTQLAAALARLYGAPEREGGSDRYLAIARAASHLEKHFREPFDLQALERLTRMSGRGLRRHFKALLGRSPGDYVLHLRIEEAKRLLEAGRLSVTELAFDCGFSDGNYFSRVFKAQSGMAPREWRSRKGAVSR